MSFGLANVESTDNLEKMKSRVDCNELKSECNGRKCRQHLCADIFSRNLVVMEDRFMGQNLAGNMWTVEVFCVHIHR